jgi:hypothetical protein
MSTCVRLDGTAANANFDLEKKEKSAHSTFRNIRPHCPSNSFFWILPFLILSLYLWVYSELTLFDVSISISYYFFLSFYNLQFVCLSFFLSPKIWIKHVVTWMYFLFVNVHFWLCNASKHQLDWCWKTIILRKSVNHLSVSLQPYSLVLKLLTFCLSWPPSMNSCFSCFHWKK